jgi:hypothetical protein
MMITQRQFKLVFVLMMMILLPGVSRAYPVSSASPGLPDVLPPPPGVQGPFLSTAVGPAVFNGDLHDLAKVDPGSPDIPGVLRYTPGQEPKAGISQNADWVDAVAQTANGFGLMPAPIRDFAGLNFLNHGAGWPPDTVGDVGPQHYIQAVNISIGIFDKNTGLLATPALTFNQFFTGPPGTPCDAANRGDPVVLYDPVVGRWLVSDFAWFNQTTGPFYECIAVSQTSDPVAGGWFFYALRADTGNFTGYLNDYPKLGVWSDGWYMTANMFQMVAPGTGFGVRLWALDRAAMVSGTLREVHFDCMDLDCASMLPSNLRGALPPSGSPAYFLSTSPPGHLNLWEFHVDWTTPANSTLTGPVPLGVADFAFAPSVPQLGSSYLLDSLSPRPMMQLQYRNLSGDESLWANHTVLSGGVAGVRWYEISDPGGTPVVAQQSTYQPDTNRRWMGSLAVDGDGNLAIGYSVSSLSMYPGIRYAGRLRGEIPNRLSQAESVLINGGGSQTGISRWGDYSAMSVDPVDDCTFWYTQEYYATTGNNWQTRIAAFKYPSCGVTKATLSGTVRNNLTDQPVPGAPVVAVSAGQTMSVLADAAGFYSLRLLPGLYTLTAGPYLPGYPISSSLTGVNAIAGQTSAQDLFLTPVPALEEASVRVDDAGANGNGSPEPGESGLSLYEGLRNAGGAPSTNISARLSSLTTGVTIESPIVTYADIVPGNTITNVVPFQFSVGSGVACGANLDFRKVVTDSVATHTIDFSLNASQVLPRANVFANDVESGANGWTTGGIGNTWGITAQQAHSPAHSWSDSPAGNYSDNANAYLRTPAYDLTGKRHLRLGAWYRYAIEPGYDYVYLEYSLDGGATWSSQPLLSFTGSQNNWVFREVDASVLDGRSNVALRYRLVSDIGLNFDGFYVDDIALSHELYGCHLKFIYAPVAYK